MAGADATAATESKDKMSTNSPFSLSNGSAEESTPQIDLLNQKDAFLNVDERQTLEQLVVCVRDRLNRANGELLLSLGHSESNENERTLTKEELKQSLVTLKKVCELIPADCVEFEDTQQSNSSTIKVVIRRKIEFDDFLEVRLAVLGNVDAGKSTLLGVLTHGQLDDGRGLARQHLLRHKHEQQTGRTSSVGCNILGFDSQGQIVNEHCLQTKNKLDWAQICVKSYKVCSLLDLAGHERYLKTTIFGLTGLEPHCAMLMVGANAGLIGMGKEHLGLCLALSVPIFVVITKLDNCPTHVANHTLQTLLKILRSSSCRRTPLLIRDEQDVWLAASSMANRRPLCPIFQLSSVTGDGLSVLRKFLSLLPPGSGSAKIGNELNSLSDSSNEPVEFQIEDRFQVPGVGTVVSGLLLSGHIKPNDTLALGPNHAGKFMNVSIKSIHRKRLPVSEVSAGHSAALALKKVKKSDLRKGMVLLSTNPEPQAYWEFIAEILVLHHPTTIAKNYQAMVHCGNVRQTASIFTMSKECLRTGDRAKVHFRFVINPEHIKVGQRIVFREGRTKAIGSIVKTIQGKSPQVRFGTRKASKTHATEGGNLTEPLMIDGSENGKTKSEEPDIPLCNLTIGSRRSSHKNK